MAFVVLLLIGCSAQPRLPIHTPISAKATIPTFTSTVTPTILLAATSSVTPLPTFTITLKPPPTKRIVPKPLRIGILGQGMISEVFRSPDGQIVAVGIGNTIHWFDDATFKEMGSFQLGLNGIMTIEFSPDSRLVGIENGSSEAQVFDLDRQVIVATLNGLNGPISDLSFTPDDKYVAFLMEDIGVGVFLGLWDINADKMERVFDVIDSDQSHVMSGPAISPDGKMLAAGCDKQVYIWDLASGQMKFVLAGHTKNITSVDFSPDGKLLASGSRDRTVRLWDTITGKLTRVISGMTDEVARVKFSSDGNELTIQNWLRPTHIWNLNDQELIVLTSQVATPDPFAVVMHYRGYSQSRFPSFSGKVLFSPDGHFLALGSEPILLWDMGKQTVATSLEGISRRFITDMQFSPNGQWLAVLDDLGNFQVWDVHNGEKQIRRESGFFTGVETQGRTHVFAFSSDSAFIAFDYQDTIEIWDVASATQRSTLQLNQDTQNIEGLVFASDGDQLYTILNRKEMQITETWDISERKLMNHFEFEIPEITYFDVFRVTDTHWPYYARNNADQNQSWIEVWNLETGQIAFQVKTPRSETEPIQFSPDGSLLMAISSNWLYVWITATGQLAFVIDQVPIDSGIAISSDNKKLAIERGGRVDLWDISQVTEDLENH